jgi:MOSC domain-containing protein
LGVVGEVTGLWRYPVKSMAGEALEAAEVGWHGLEHDRRWAFLRDDVPRSGFPWLTIRQIPELVLYRPRVAGDRVLVRTPSGEEREVLDLPLGRALKLDRGAFDSAPVSLVTTATVGEYDVRRFRPNVLISSDAGEEEWVGAELRIGGVRLRVDERDVRCAVVNVDPDTAERDPRVLKAVAPCFGVYATVVEPGRVGLGDPVHLVG